MYNYTLLYLFIMPVYLYILIGHFKKDKKQKKKKETNTCFFSLQKKRDLKNLFASLDT